MSVAGEFTRFRYNYNIGQELISSISYRYKRITRQLNWDFWGIESETNHSLYVGSYGRDTAASGISDLDIAFHLPDSTYWQYQNYLGNGQSALLQAVRTSIQKTYPLTATAGDGQVVVTAFTDGIKFEVLPVFNNKGGTWTHPDSNGGGSWSTCNPKAEIAAVNAENLVSKHNLKNLCRMMRMWKANWSVPITGILIDTLSYNFLKNWTHKDKSFEYHDYMARDFFAFLLNQSSAQTYWLAPGSNAHVRRTGRFETAAKSCYALALEAVAHDQASQEWSRRQKWRQVFGAGYPND